MAQKVLVAMSGGVDSSVSAMLLREQGYDVIGLFMITGAVETSADPAVSKRCCSAIDKADAERVTDLLDIPFYALDFRREFDRLRDDFASEYRKGRTPNPCLRCNQWIKFGNLIRRADVLGADFIATGHYARVDHEDGTFRLRSGVDPTKNQTYFLFTLGQRELGRTLFPVGGFEKDEIRRLAREGGLAVSEKPESQDICFVARSYHELVEERTGPGTPGPIRLGDGTEVGRHGGTIRFTVGQRRGLSVALGERHYVTAIDPERNTVYLGREAELERSDLTVSELNWVDGVPRGPEDRVEAWVQIRYRHRPVPAVIQPLDSGSARVEFQEPEKAIAPGQAAVFYRGDEVLGGGIID